jgi:hypothetical protein
MRTTLLALLFAPLLLSPASADSINFLLNNGDATLDAFAGTDGPYANVNVNLLNARVARITVTGLSSDGYRWLIGGPDSVDLNIDAARWRIGPIAELNRFRGFREGPARNGGRDLSISEFGAFDQTLNSTDGYARSAERVSFLLRSTSILWLSAADVLEPNDLGFLAAVHVFACPNPCRFRAGDVAAVSGYASNGIDGGIPSPSSVPGPIAGAGIPGLIAALGIIGLARRRRARAAKLIQTKAPALPSGTSRR